MRALFSAWAFFPESKTAQVGKAFLAHVQAWSTSESCSEDSTEGCVGDRELYLARVYETLACAYAINGKRKDALANMDLCSGLDPKNKSFLERREEWKKRDQKSKFIHFSH
ncbi:MAG: hypothetical protein ACI8X5_000668 [Planctomycetota bacterium]|jgi:hypothetical protein